MSADTAGGPARRRDFQPQNRR